MRFVVIALLLAPSISTAKALPWVVSADRAVQLVKAGALVFDVRPASSRPHLRGAVKTSWQHFSRPPGAQHGRLLPLAKLQARLRVLGVRNETTMLLVGDPRRGWGDDGRLVWMLRSVGHRRVAFVDGGAAALKRALGPIAITAPRGPGDFKARAISRWSANRARVHRGLRNRDVVFVDTRTVAEYRGKTPWGERRGGHLPGAVHLPFRALLDARGKLLPREKLSALLKERKLERDKAIIAYCTGGIRSAWLVAVLVELGYRDVRNYAGSIWQWSAGPKSRYPLVGR